MDGTQTVYLDGVLVNTGGTGFGGQMDTGLNVLLGTSGNGGSFSGQLDEVKVFDTQLSVAQIQSEMGVPEPTTIGAIAAVGLFAGSMRRRRRSAR